MTQRHVEMMRLDGRIAVITGGARGIGAETARVFREAGATVVTWDVSDGADQRVDVTNAKAVDAAVTATVAKLGGIDILVNNAGILRDAQLVRWKDGSVAGRMEEKDFDSLISVNLKGVFLCARAATPHLIRSGGGAILNATSVVGLYGNFGQTNYVASKAGVIGMTRTWARELGRYGIRVNAVAPGFIATEILKAMPEKVIASMVQHTPLGRMGTPEDVANAYAWLASDEASFVTGEVLSVDGGIVVGT